AAMLEWGWPQVHPRPWIVTGCWGDPSLPRCGQAGPEAPDCRRRSASDPTMSSPPFVHPHCHRPYSPPDGASKIPHPGRRVKALGMPAVALTDHGNLYGAVEFLREAKAADIVPIVGLEAYVAPGRRTERGGGGASGQEYAFHLTLLARNAAGFRNLMRLS